MNVKMMLSISLGLLSLCLSAHADLLYATYPPPRDLSSDESLVARAWKNLTQTLDAYLKDDRSKSTSEVLLGTENLTFSASLFSLHDPAATALQYHYTAPNIANAPNGTHEVDGDSIYKIASVSKLITAFAGQLKLSNEDWNRPLSDILPELIKPNRTDIVYDVQWDKITPLALASHLAGIPPVGLPQNDLLLQSLIAGKSTIFGLPPLNLTVLGPCALSTEPLCSPGEFIASESIQPPISEPFSFPTYSDATFFLLGLVIEKITGATIQDVYNDAIFKPLEMTLSNGSVPTGEAFSSHAVVSSIEFELDGSFTIPSGSLYSTVNDLSKLGVGILNSTLLAPEKTRKWLKPVTHTASLTYSIGAPWEIIRYIHPTGKITEIYGKLGDSGSYGGYLAVIPDYDAGIAFLNTAGPDYVARGGFANVLLDQITQNILPALEAEAAAEAKKNYVGTYTSVDKNLNSSVTVSFNESTVPGASDSLSLSSWISNGTDVLPAAVTVIGTLVPRLLPTIFNQKHGAGRIAFYASGQNQSNSYLGSPFAAGPHTGFYKTNFDFAVTGQNLWGGALLNEFVFDMDGEGKAAAVTSSAARVRLERQA